MAGRLEKAIANQNAPKLAHFILDFKSKCHQSNIRIIAHSLEPDFDITRPGNYIQQSVAGELFLSDANGTAQFDCLDYWVPVYDNHCGYIGFRDPLNQNSLRGDGGYCSK